MVKTADKPEINPVDTVDTPQQNPVEASTQQEEARESAGFDRETLISEIESNKKKLYELIIDSYKDQTLSFTGTEGQEKMKKEVLNKIQSVDQKLWKEIAAYFDSIPASIVEELKKLDQDYKAFSLFVEASKRNEALATMFVQDVFDKLKDSKDEVSSFKIEKNTANIFKIIPVSSAEESVKSEDEKSAEGEAKSTDTQKEMGPNYDEMAEAILKEGGFAVTLMSAFGIIPNKEKDGRSAKELQKEAIIRGLKGEDFVLGWIFGVMGIKTCKESVAGLDSFIKNTPFEGTYDKFKERVSSYGDKASKLVDRVNGVGDIEQSEGQKSVTNSILGKTEIQTGIVVGKEPVVFGGDEKVSSTHDLQIIIPEKDGAQVAFGNIVDAKVDGKKKTFVSSDVIQPSGKENYVLTVPAETTIPKDTTFGPGVTYRYVEKEQVDA